jgi:hypothetical protein
MHTVDCDLTSKQWQALKAIRNGKTKATLFAPPVLESLMALDLAVMDHDTPVVTEKGRKVLLRGSPKLWDSVT